MGSLFHDFSIPHTEDPVRIFDGGKPVRNDDRGPAAAKFFHGFLNERFRFIVQRAGGFIKDQHRRIFQEDPRKTDPLFLSAGKTHAIFTAVGIKSQWQSLDKIVNIRRFCRLDQFFFGGIQFAEKDIFPDRCVKKERSLLDDPHIGTEQFLRHIPHIQTVDHHAALCDIVESRHEGGKSGFSCAGFAYDRHCFSGRDLQRDIVKYKIFLLAHIRIFELHMVEADPALHGCFQFGDGIGFIRHIRLFVHHFAEAFHRAHSLKVLLCKIHEAHNGHGDLMGIHEEGDQFGISCQFPIDKHRTDPDVDDGISVHEKHHAGMKDRHCGKDPFIGFPVGMVHFLKLADLAFFIGVGFDFPHALDGIFHSAVDLCHFFTDVPVHFPGTRQDPGTPHDHQRHGQERQECQQRIQTQHHGKAAEKHDDGGYQAFGAMM